MNNRQHGLTPEAAFAPLVEQMKKLSEDLFKIRERAHADDLDSVSDEINSLPGKLKDFTPRLEARMKSFERKLSGRSDREWIEDGLGRFESYARALSVELSALREEVDAKYNRLSGVLKDFHEKLDMSVKIFATTTREKLQ